jgi:hypothetical protein
MTARAHDLLLAPEPTSVDSWTRLREAVGLPANHKPAWAPQLLTEVVVRHIGERWDPDAEVFSWHADDRVSLTPMARSREVSLTGLAPAVTLELLTNLASDITNHRAASPTATRGVVRELVAGEARSLDGIDPSRIASLSRGVWRRWTQRLELAAANPEEEWLRDVVRMRVVKPGSRSNDRLRLGDIEQPWLRDLTVALLRVRVNDLATVTIVKRVISVLRLSRLLAARKDGGRQPSRLTGIAMNVAVAGLRAEEGSNDRAGASVLKDWSAVLTEARTLGFADRINLPPSFALRRDHHPKLTRVVREDRGLPDATFRFLLGVDDLLGERITSLARSIPADDFFGEMFVTAVRLAANFGRRPEELCALSAQRLRVSDTGAAELLYDNFKSGRDKVWLPVDARSAQLARSWISRIRDRYPETPMGELALFPKSQTNPRGDQSMRAGQLQSWFRGWVMLLDQAIVMGHLHAATGATLEDLCLMTLRDASPRHFRVGGAEHELDSATAQVLTDYAAEVVSIEGASKHAPPEPGDLPLFSDPLQRAHGGESRSDRFLRIPVDFMRFAGLGKGWLPIAARYPSGGIPGHNLGDSRMPRHAISVRLFRHTYLQHLVNIGEDIFVVAELADHRNVQTTIDSYVRVQDEKLREAVDRLTIHRLNQFGRPIRYAMPLISSSARDVGTNDCLNPQVLELGTEGCDRDHMCFDCDHYAADPSNIPDIKGEIRTCNLTLARLEASHGPEGNELKPHHLAMLRARRDGWRRMLDALTAHLEALDPTERERVETAAVIVRDFRNRVRSGGINLGGRLPFLTTPGM